MNYFIKENRTDDYTMIDHISKCIKMNENEKMSKILGKEEVKK